jgi:DNA-nicking Smr family endonuclease
MASVRPIKPVPVPQASSPSPLAAAAPPVPLSHRERGRARPAQPAGGGEGERARPTPHHAATLDASWDRRLSRGLTQPDSSLDLHGHSLASAYALLDRGLERAVARGDRVLLLVTGKPPRPESERPHARGAIRAAVADWLAQSRHADRIAAVRNAHPRHGGAGALYIVLRRR